MDIKELIEHGEAIYAERYTTEAPPKTPGVVVVHIPETFIRDRDAKISWDELCSVFLRETFPNNPKVSDFETLYKSEHRRYYADTCYKQIAILTALSAINPTLPKVDIDSTLINIFNKFQKIEQQLAHRHDGRETLRINDEYDVQDLLHALLRLYFDDIRAEEYTPSYAGSSKRMDFLLNDDQIVIEVKMTRQGLNDKKVGEELTIDIAYYKSHPKCKKIYCFVYDREGHIRNPRGVEKDLNKQSTPEMAVSVLIRPE